MIDRSIQDGFAAVRNNLLVDAQEGRIVVPYDVRVFEMPLFPTGVRCVKVWWWLASGRWESINASVSSERGTADELELTLRRDLEHTLRTA